MGAQVAIISGFGIEVLNATQNIWIMLFFCLALGMVIGTFLGVLMFKIISNTLVAAKVPTFLTGAISGGIIIIAVLLQSMRGKKK